MSTTISVADATPKIQKEMERYKSDKSFPHAASHSSLTTVHPGKEFETLEHRLNHRRHLGSEEAGLGVYGQYTCLHARIAYDLCQGLVTEATPHGTFERAFVPPRDIGLPLLKRGLTKWYTNMSRVGERTWVTQHPRSGPLQEGGPSLRDVFHQHVQRGGAMEKFGQPIGKGITHFQLNLIMGTAETPNSEGKAIDEKEPVVYEGELCAKMHEATEGFSPPSSLKDLYSVSWYDVGGTKVQHIHLTHCPNMMEPDQKGLDSFVEAAKYAATLDTVKIIQCQAGVGRAGTFASTVSGIEYINSCLSTLRDPKAEDKEKLIELSQQLRSRFTWQYENGTTRAGGNAGTDLSAESRASTKRLNYLLKRHLNFDPASDWEGFYCSRTGFQRRSPSGPEIAPAPRSDGDKEERVEAVSRLPPLDLTACDSLHSLAVLEFDQSSEARPTGEKQYHVEMAAYAFAHVLKAHIDETLRSLEVSEMKRERAEESRSAGTRRRASTM